MSVVHETVSDGCLPRDPNLEDGQGITPQVQDDTPNENPLGASSSAAQVATTVTIPPTEQRLQEACDYITTLEEKNCMLEIQPILRMSSAYLITATLLTVTVILSV